MMVIAKDEVNRLTEERLKEAPGKNRHRNKRRKRKREN
jgi:hypothetical protein